MPDSENYYIVNDKLYEYEDAVGRFRRAHDLFHGNLQDPTDILESEEYFKTELQRINEFQQEIKRWGDNARI